MTRLRPQLGSLEIGVGRRSALGAARATRVALALLCWALCSACGGSASETPPPLEPDPRGFHYAPALPPAVETSDAGDAPAASGDSEDKAVNGGGSLAH